MNRKPRKLIIIFAAALAMVSMLAKTASAGGGTATTITTSRPLTDICIGDVITYTVGKTGSDPVQSVKWSYIWGGCTPPATAIIAPGGNLSINLNENLVGVCDLTATITFVNYPGTTTYTSSTTLTVTTLPPDTAVMQSTPAVLNVPVNTIAGPPPSFNVIFLMQRNGRTLNITGMPIVEMLDRTIFKNGGTDTPWGAGTFINNTGPGTITDQKGVMSGAGFDAIPVNGFIDQFNQSVGVRLPTGCGPILEVHLTPAFGLGMVKVNATQWMLVTCSPPPPCP